MSLNSGADPDERASVTWSRSHWEARFCELAALVMAEALLTGTDSAAACLRAIEGMGIPRESWPYVFSARYRALIALAQS